MRNLHRRLSAFALATSSIAVAAASYIREGMNPLAVLPTLGTVAPWQAAGVPLTAIAALCALLAAVACLGSRRMRIDGTLIGLSVGLLAAVATYSYDLCADAGMSWLPQFGGCHCWLTGAAAVLGALLSAVVVFLFGVFSVRFVQYISARVAAHIRRIRQRAVARRLRARTSRLCAEICFRLIAFRGPPLAHALIA